MRNATTDTVDVVTNGNSKSFTREDFAVEFLRQVRNTGHGFSLRDDRFENVLAITSGEVPSEILDLLDGLWHTVLVDPLGYLVQRWGL